MAHSAMPYNSETPASENQDVSQERCEAEALKGLLITVAEKRDRCAFAELFQRFAPRIRVYGLKHLNQEAQALELVQETMMTVWRKAHLYNPSKGAASTWIYTVMRNQCYDFLRKVQSNREFSCSDEIWPLFEHPDSAEEAHEVTSRERLSSELYEQLQKLPSAQKDVVEGLYIRELTQQELAKQLGIPIGTVKSRLRLALGKLRGYMNHDD